MSIDEQSAARLYGHINATMRAIKAKVAPSVEEELSWAFSLATVQGSNVQQIGRSVFLVGPQRQPVYNHIFGRVLLHKQGERPDTLTPEVLKKASYPKDLLFHLCGPDQTPETSIDHEHCKLQDIVDDVYRFLRHGQPSRFTVINA